jgi:two-component system sensor histidine kinase DevS
MLLTREELRERLIALHQASLELVKDVSLDTLLEKIASVACEQADARYAALGVLDGKGGLEKFISVGMSDSEVKRIAHPPEGKGLIGELMNADEPLRIPHISKHPSSVGFPDHHPEMDSFLGVPILAGEIQLGQIYLTEKIGAEEFTEDDERIIQMLAAYAAAAIQNARMYQHLKERDTALTRRSEDMALLNDFASTLTASLEIDEILNKTLALVMNYLKVEAGEIFLLEDDRETLRMVLHRGQAAEAFWTRSQFKLDDGFIGVVAKERKPLISHDLTNDLRFVRKAVVKAGFRQVACIPLESTENMVGVMSVATRSEIPIDEREIHLLGAVANWAALAIDNARLHQNARRLAVLEERERIGMDLHDGIIQSIFGVGLSMENISHLVRENPQKAREGITHAIDDLNQIIRDLRAYILDLRPRQLDDEDLMDGLRRLITEYRAHTLAEADLSGPKNGLHDLPQTHATILFHICQEALANAAKHAGAKKVNVSVWVADDRVMMEINDNGRGFNMDDTKMSLGHGLANMLTRAHSVGGEVDISSVLNNGTTVLAWVPLNSSA